MGLEEQHSGQREEDRFRLLVESVTDYAIYMLDPKGNVASWNSGAQRFKGYLPHEIIGEHFSRFYTEEDRAVDLPRKALRTAEQEGRFEHEGWRVRKDGTRFWATSSSIQSATPQPGQLIGYAKITRDMTERKLAQESLRRSEERFRMLVQGVTDYAIYMLDPDGCITNWNTGAQRIKGYSEDEIVGNTSRASIPQRIAKRGSRQSRLKRLPGKDASRKRRGASARTAPGSGLAWSSIRSVPPMELCWAMPRSRVI